MNSQAICERIETLGLVPVVRAKTAAIALRAAQALLAAEIDVIEITMTVPGALDVLAELRQRFSPRVLLGAGTVLTPDQAHASIEAGAEFVLSPGLNLETVRVVRELGKAAIPGALTPTEVTLAWQAGAHMVKVFPCSAVGGAKYLRALRAPLPQVKLLPTGGVNLDTAAEYLAAGAAALGVGAALVDLALLEQAGDDALTERAAQFVSVVRNARRALAR